MMISLTLDQNKVYVYIVNICVESLLYFILHLHTDLCLQVAPFLIDGNENVYVHCIGNQ